VHARRALESVEDRYRNLFARSPSPFIMHRSGRILAANDAAARFFGFASADAMRGLELLQLNHGHSRELSAQRLAALETMAPGESVPNAELSLRRADGADLLAQVSVVRIALDDGPANLSIHFDLTERRAAEAVLAEAKEAAEAANRAKSAFLANMSHEIRTPLNGLLGLVRLALDPATGGERKNNYLRRIADSAQALTGVISDILDLSKIEAGKLVIENVAFDLRELVEAIAGDARLLGPRGKSGPGHRVIDRRRRAGAPVTWCRTAGRPRRPVRARCTRAHRGGRRAPRRTAARRGGPAGTRSRLPAKRPAPGTTPAPRARRAS
jgi:PAS domain S-box-containing protein